MVRPWHHHHRGGRHLGRRGAAPRLDDEVTGDPSDRVVGVGRDHAGQEVGAGTTPHVVGYRHGIQLWVPVESHVAVTEITNTLTPCSEECCEGTGVGCPVQCTLCDPHRSFEGSSAMRRGNGHHVGDRLEPRLAGSSSRQPGAAHHQTSHGVPDEDEGPHGNRPTGVERTERLGEEPTVLLDRETTDVPDEHRCGTALLDHLIHEAGLARCSQPDVRRLGEAVDEHDDVGSCRREDLGHVLRSEQHVPVGVGHRQARRRSDGHQRVIVTPEPLDDRSELVVPGTVCPPTGIDAESHGVEAESDRPVDGGRHESCRNPDGIAGAAGNGEPTPGDGVVHPLDGFGDAPCRKRDGRTERDHCGRFLVGDQNRSAAPIA